MHDMQEFVPNRKYVTRMSVGQRSRSEGVTLRILELGHFYNKMERFATAGSPITSPKSVLEI